MNIQWEAGKYASNFNFVPQYGKDVIGLIQAPAGSRVLDLGCGNGTLTEALARRGYRVLGMDASPELVALAKEQHPDLSFTEGDATTFTLPEPVDVIFSNAVFHWIDRDRQPLLAGCIARALRKGGELVCEFGGYGNNAKIHQALEQAFARWGLAYQMPFYFPTIGTYAALLERQSLQVRYATLFDRFTELQGEDGLTDWIRMFVKRPFTGMEQTLQEDIVREAVNALRNDLYKDGKWYADYVRIRLRAVKQ